MRRPATVHGAEGWRTGSAVSVCDNSYPWRSAACRRLSTALFHNAEVAVRGLVVGAALGIEARALRHGLSTIPVVQVGYRARRAHRLPDYDVLLVAGFGGALTTDLRPGDVVVATEIRGTNVSVPGTAAPALADEFRRDGLPAVMAPLRTTDHVVRSAEVAELAATGARVVDMESAVLAVAAGTRPVAAVRVIVDTPDHPLPRPSTLWHGTAAWRTLRRLGPSLERWATTLHRTPD
jgi:4-hydroxy-3-methylbut-2-enyl diphosphate reductase